MKDRAQSFCCSFTAISYRKAYRLTIKKFFLNSLFSCFSYPGRTNRTFKRIESQYNLLEGLEQQCISTCLPRDPERSPREYLLTAARNVFDFFDAHRKLYLACITSGADVQVHALEECAAQELGRLLSEPRFRSVSPQVDPQVAAHFYTGAMLGLIRWWLTDSHPLPASQLLANLEQFIPIQ